MKLKNLVSLAVALVFSVLSVTGLLIYFGQGSRGVDHMHAWFGVLFVTAAVFHIVNNWSSLVGYTVARRSGKIQKEIWLPALVVGIFAFGIGFNLLGLDALGNAGKNLVNGPRKPGPERLTFETVATNDSTGGTPLTLMLQPGKDTQSPLVVAWVEDSAGRFVENLFVPAQVATPAPEGPPRFAPFSATALPGWQAKATTKQPNFDKATPNGPFLLNTTTTASGRYRVIVAVRAGDQTERYEARIVPGQRDVFRLQADVSRLLDRALVEVGGKASIPNSGLAETR
jgi:hypothetical protein